jgi:hypothetical protein
VVRFVVKIESCSLRIPPLPNTVLTVASTIAHHLGLRTYTLSSLRVCLTSTYLLLPPLPLDLLSHARLIESHVNHAGELSVPTTACRLALSQSFPVLPPGRACFGLLFGDLVCVGLFDFRSSRPSLAEKGPSTTPGFELDTHFPPITATKQQQPFAPQHTFQPSPSLGVQH